MTKMDKNKWLLDGDNEDFTDDNIKDVADEEEEDEDEETDETKKDKGETEDNFE